MQTAGKNEQVTYFFTSKQQLIGTATWKPRYVCHDDNANTHAVTYADN